VCSALPDLLQCHKYVLKDAAPVTGKDDWRMYKTLTATDIKSEL